MASPPVIPKQFTYEIITTDLNSPIKEIQDYTNLDLEPFEKSPIWSNNYLSQLNIQRQPFAFQIELVQSVINSGNSLVSLRTGAGKTYIAALLIKYYYMKKQKEENKQFLTFFFIPNRSIRDQQVAAIHDVGDLRVMPCDDDSSVHEFVQYSHVIVCTPQKFLNCLVDKTIFLNQVDLLIFDECHHCIGNHPYSKIMEQYLVYHPLEHQPKIIGLTASCGTKLTRPELVFEELSNSQKRQHNALNKLYELCATLNCNNVVTIKNAEHIEELSKKIHMPIDDQILTVQSMSFDQHLKKLGATIESLLEYIGSQCSPTIDKFTDEQNLVEKKKDAEKQNNFTNVILIKYMIMFVKRLDALTDLPLKSIINDIINKIDLFYNKKETPMAIETEVHDYCIQTMNSIVEQLKESQYYLTNPKLDFLTDLLQRLIKQRDDARGLSNVLIATDIVQEGLDVPECSFIIRYEFVSNEIGTVQSRGRARAEKSSCFLVVDEGSKNHVKEMTNRLKEKEMLEALNRWQQISSHDLKLNLQKVQNRIIDEWRAAADLKKRIQSTLQDSEDIDGKVSCRACDYYLGEISWIRKRNNSYFVQQQQLAEHVEIELYSSAKMYKEIQVNGKVRCGNRKCREDIGGVQQYTDRPDIREICALACKKLKFTLKDPDGDCKVSMVNKWTEITFKIPELEPLMSINVAPDQQ
ncbi:unnamed protein product [Rotaria socialis]|uniref:RNA helicase n=1 Tax=Rotaria socialis TaxID=392032 RepID=A0A820VEZ9_9BILA|nr:unnamed protein product [Rotaria socialis]CAF4127511.1 unnamed protein product [Rotaria socialis]CAF4500129.1 unnamed protein product [Rotaria socialis]